MNKNMKKVLGVACLGLWAQAAVTGVLADSLVPPGVPEPGLIIWGTVVSTSDNSSPVTIDSASWDVTDGNKHVILSGESYVRIVDKNTYILQVPFDTRTFNNATLEAPVNSFELKSASPNYTLTPTINGEAAKIVKVEGSPSSGESYRTSLTTTERGKVIRLDLAVESDPWIEFCNKYFPGMDPDAIRNIDSDGDGATNYEEFLEGTDPTKMDGWHSADSNHNFEIEVGELLRVIQIFNTDGYYHTDMTAPDGFRPGEGEISQYHDSDYLEPRGEITMRELLRLITFYNSDDGYRRDSSQIDGFKPIYVNAASDVMESDDGEMMTAVRSFSPKLYAAGEKLQVDVIIDGNSDLHSLGLLEVLPKGWTLEKVLNNDVHYRLRENKGTLEFYWLDIPELPCKVSYLLNAPSDAKGYYAFGGNVLWYEIDDLMENVTTGNWIIGDEDIHGKLGYLQLPDGDLAIIFEGELYESEDLIQWELLKGVESPYVIELKDGKHFYHSITK